jgi:hypothetical protein
MRHVLFSSLLLTLAATAVAQTPIVARGRVTDGSAAGCYYCPGYQHVFKYSGLRLESTTVNLAPFMNLDVRVVGTWNGSWVNVTSIQLAPESFGISGGGLIGGHFELTTHGPAGDLAINLLALGSGCIVPLGDCGLQLAAATTVIHGAGVIDSSGEFETTLPIPMQPSLIGLRLFGQGVALSNGLFWSTNPDAKEIG